LSRLNDLIRQVNEKDPSLAADLQREVAALADRRAFGLNFERHVPEAVELPGRRVRRGDKVRILPARGQTPKKSDEKLWRVRSIERNGDSRAAELVALADETETITAAVEDLVVVAEFRDPIYPGLVSTGKVERGGDKPHHTVINAENFHALQLLMFTHRGKIDCIYIDPPYNTGARDWKYNNDYVEADDHYRHSKWLAFMERRLLLAKELLDPDESVLIVTIDEKEVHRLGLLLSQTFPDALIQMVSDQINPANVARRGAFGRSDEYLFFVMIGGAAPQRVILGADWVSARGRTFTGSVRWDLLRRSGTNARRIDRPKLFYPVLVDPTRKAVVGVGDSIALEVEPASIEAPDGTIAVWPIRKDGSEGNWQLGPAALMRHVEQGRVRLGGSVEKGFVVYYIKGGEYEKVIRGDYPVLGRKSDGSLDLGSSDEVINLAVPGTQWRIAAHDATQYGSRLLNAFLPGRNFPFPKSLYSVEDALRFFIINKPRATVLDFFAGSGTTAHAVMRLNKQDDGQRQCILLTNNEVSAEEQTMLRMEGLRPGDATWEGSGICDYITKPRIEALITGTAPDGVPIKGDYKFRDEFPFADGFKENVEFFRLTYEAPLRVASNREFERVAPLLWMRAGSRGSRIDNISKGWDVAETYGVIADFDHTDDFMNALATKPDATHAFVVTDEDWLFESVCRDLPEHIEPVRLYEAYLRNFEIEAGRGAR
jgi:adenine-specific DNA-methyltransferase